MIFLSLQYIELESNSLGTKDTNSIESFKRMRTRQYDGVDSSEHLKGVKKHCIKLAIKITLLRGSRTDWLASVWVVCSVVRMAHDFGPA